MIIVKNRNGRIGIPRTCCLNSHVYEINLAQGDQRNTSHIRCTSERGIQDLGSSYNDCLGTSAVVLVKPDDWIKDP